MRQGQNSGAVSLGIAGVSLALVSGAAASTNEATTNMRSTSHHEIFLGEEEISDVSLATFYIFDKENNGPPLAQRLRLARCGRGYGCRNGSGGCGSCGGCGHPSGNGGCGGGVDGYP